jgi:hypothetical protein
LRQIVRPYLENPQPKKTSLTPKRKEEEERKFMVSESIMQ